MSIVSLGVQGYRGVRALTTYWGRDKDNALNLRHHIELNCEGDPFTVGSLLKSPVSSAIVPEKAKYDILCNAEEGKKQFEQFVRERQLLISKLSVWDSMKLKPKTFSSITEKTQFRV